MKIFGKSLSEYVRFERGFLILILVVGLARLILSLLGMPNSAVKFISITVALLLGMLYYSVTVHTSGFGSYKQLLPVLALPAILGSSIVVAGIVISILTHKDNIFSAPELSSGKFDFRIAAVRPPLSLPKSVQFLRPTAIARRLLIARTPPGVAMHRGIPA